MTKAGDGTRPYRMRERADAVAATRERILAATYELVFHCTYDELTLQRVATEAGTTFHTVLRHFGSKDGLIAAVAQRFGPEEQTRRRVDPGDVGGAARVLCERYEATADGTLHWEALEDRVEALADAMHAARAAHRAWLEQVFAESLATLAPAERRRVVAELFAATDINTWRLWRRRLGLSRADTRRAMEDLVRSVLATAASHRS